MHAYKLAILFASLLFLPFFAFSEEAILLAQPGKPALGWTFDNGKEFPGATGSLTVDSEAKYEGKESLKLTGDFTGGGNYVQAATLIPEVDVRDLMFSIKNWQRDQITIRVIDGAGRCHQFNLKTEPKEGWQKISFPVERFFENQGKSSAVTTVAKYEAWGGGGTQYNNDGQWTGPARSLVILIGKKADQPVNTVWINGVTVIPRAKEEKKVDIVNSVRLDEVIDGEHFWRFINGQEFPGAKGEIAIVKDEPGAGSYAMDLKADFSAGGLYVAAIKEFADLEAKDISAIRLKVKSDSVSSLGIRIGDNSGQTHQKKDVKIIADGQWHELVIKPSDIAGGEHWGGANDGKLHAPPKYISIGIGKQQDPTKKLSLKMAEIQADAIFTSKSGEPVYQNDFEAGGKSLTDWKIEGKADLATGEAFKGKHSLVLEKSEATLRSPLAAVSKTFDVLPGNVEVKFSTKSALTSMDNSYNGSLTMEFLDGSGKSVGTSELATIFRNNNWKESKKSVEVPASAASARFVAKINKETPGQFWIDELSVVPLVGEKKDNRIQRLMFATAQVGNLLLPSDSKEVTLELWASKPIPAEQRQVSLILRDYWGAEQTKPMLVELQKDTKKEATFRYTGKLDLTKAPIEVGRYYELHATINRGNDEPFTNYTSFAVLPEAAANAYPAEQVPFTSRNWDNRLEAYVRLTKRLGIRIVGVWGKMEADPAKVEAPQIELAETLNLGILTGSPAHSVEQRSKGWRDLLANDGELMRQGVRNWIAKYGKYRPLIINLGNEPHSKGEGVKFDVEAYRIVYTEIKKIDPTIYVVGTSVGTQEDYFKAGFGEWLDAYDFHVYEDALGVRRAVEVKYPELFKKYGFAKPVWSTEVGLNSQGMARQFVAAEVYRKFVNFFAGGGANISWFGLLYPDSDGKNADSFGSAHNVFDCRYNRYAPKLDAIAYYNVVNAIAIKKYVQDVTYDSGTHAFLFKDRDQKALQVWYKEKGREDLLIPLPGVNAVEVIKIDGTRSTLQAGGKGITLTVTEDPILLLYEGGADKLADKPGEAIAKVASFSPSIVRGEGSGVEILTASQNKITPKLPPYWEAIPKPISGGATGVRFDFAVPEDSIIREADLTFTVTGSDGKPNGELYLRPSVTGMVSVQILPQPLQEGQEPKISLRIDNNSAKPQEVSWDISFLGEQALKEGVFSNAGATEAYFAETPSGVVEIGGKQSAEIPLSFVGADLLKVYKMHAVVRDPSGRVTTQDRPVSAFYGVTKATVAPALDGNLDEGDWKNAPVRRLEKRDQFYAFQTKEKTPQDWKDTNDLSAEIRYLWDDKYLYVGVKVTDDIAGAVTKADGNMWQQDSLQFLVDPMRTNERKVGKYEYTVSLGTKGPQVWCTLSADGDAPTGDAADVKVKIKNDQVGTGNVTYEVAIPWSRLAPFKPNVGGNLGFTLIVNEDDGAGRDAFMTWFGNAHSKDIDTVGDLVLLP